MAKNSSSKVRKVHCNPFKRSVSSKKTRLKKRLSLLKDNLGFSTELIMYIGHREEFLKQMF